MPKTPIVRTHPLAEIIASRLFGITGVPKAEQARMVNRAVKAAVQFYDSQQSENYGKIEKALERFLELANSLHCECDSYNDRILAKDALSKIRQSRET